MKKTLFLLIALTLIVSPCFAGKTIKNAPGGKRTAAQLTNTMAIPLDAGTADYWTDLAEHYLWIKAQTDVLYAAKPWYDGAASSGSVIKLYGPTVAEGGHGTWTALQGADYNGTENTGMTWRLPIVAYPTAGTTSILNVDEYGQMGLTTTLSPTTFNLPSSNASPATTAGQIRHDTTVTGLTGGAVAWWDGSTVRYLVDLDTLPSSDDYVVAYDADADKFYMKADSVAEEGSATTMNDIGDATADGTVALAGYKIDWTSTLNSAGSVFKLSNSTADLTADVSFLDLVYVDDGDANGFFLRGYDNTSDLKWSIGVDGAIVAGTYNGITVAGGTNTFSLTNGTASLDIAAGAALNIDTGLQTTTGAITLAGQAGGSSVTLPASGTLATTALTGTSATTFQLNNGSSGPKLKDNSGVIEARNAADDAYADMKGKDAYFAHIYSTGADGTYYGNNDNTVAITFTPAQGDFWSESGVFKGHDGTTTRNFYHSGNLTNPINLADSATASQPLLSGGSGGDPAYASYAFSGTSGQTYTFPSTSKTLAATDGSNLSLSSASLATALTDETGSGVAVFATSPTLVTPNIGAATGTSLSLSGAVTGLVPSIVLTHASGVHDGSNDAAIMTDSGESFGTNAMVGMTVYNVTDASSCTVTANDGTTITCTLDGGTDNNWDTSDVWQVGPGPNQSGSTFYVSLASTIRHPATAGYAAGYYVDGAVAVTVEVADTMTIEGATASAVDAGDTIDSPATANSFIWLHNKSTTVAKTHGKNGTWTDGGAS